MARCVGKRRATNKRLKTRKVGRPVVGSHIRSTRREPCLIMPAPAEKPMIRNNVRPQQVLLKGVCALFLLTRISIMLKAMNGVIAGAIPVSSPDGGSFPGSYGRKS